MPRANLPATAEDEFYVVDLLGCRAEALDGAVLGEVVGVYNYGAGDVFSVKPPNGGPNLMVTFTKETVPLVDLAGRRVVIDPPVVEATKATKARVRLRARPLGCRDAVRRFHHHALPGSLSWHARHFADRQGVTRWRVDARCLATPRFRHRPTQAMSMTRRLAAAGMVLPRGRGRRRD